MLRSDAKICVGEMLKSRRKQLGWTQTDVAKRIGVSYQQVQKYESGTNDISVGRFAYVCHVLGMKPAQTFAELLQDAADVFADEWPPTYNAEISQISAKLRPEARILLLEIARVFLNAQSGDASAVEHLVRIDRPSDPGSSAIDQESIGRLPPN